ERRAPRAPERAMPPSSASSLPRWPSVTAPTGNTSTRPISRPRAATISTTPALSATGAVVGMGEAVGVSPRGAPPRSGLDGLGVLAARLAQVDVQVDQAGADDQPVAVDD